MSELKRVFVAIIMVAAAIQSGAAATAAGVGTVDAVDYERGVILVDGRQYALSQDLVLQYANQPSRIASVRTLRPGMAVRYELADNEVQPPRLVRLLILTGE